MDEKKPQILTFGCRLNIYESAVMQDHAEKAGLDDVIIVNTCAVTKEAERQARQAIRKAYRENPHKKIIVTGCSAQIDPKTYAEMPEVSKVIGNDLKMKAETWSHPSDKRVVLNDIMAVKETAGHLVQGFQGKARAFVQVQQGCDHRCTFCIIPYGRGNSRSVPVGVIVDQVRKLYETGHKEIVLTGVDISSYGQDLPGTPSLGQMIRRLIGLVPEIHRIRLSSIDPAEVDQDLWRLIAEEPRLMPHLHLSMQAGDDMILKRMKRRHLRHDLYDLCRKARDLRPDMVFGADVIAGFPTETEEMFENTRKTVEECDITHLHVFPYSEREGTPAARMPQVDKQTRRERAAVLRQAGQSNLEKFLTRQIGKTGEILIEKDNTGHTEHFVPVCLKEDGIGFRPGEIVGSRITGHADSRLLAEAIS